jgi:hypothetical protein
VRGAIGGGWTLATLAGSGTLALTAPGTGPIRPTVGLDTGFSKVRFDEEGGDRRLDTLRWHAGIGAGLAL